LFLAVVNDADHELAPRWLRSRIRPERQIGRVSSPTRWT
jgi:hypothetical protein